MRGPRRDPAQSHCARAQYIHPGQGREQPLPTSWGQRELTPIQRAQANPQPPGKQVEKIDAVDLEPGVEQAAGKLTRGGVMAGSNARRYDHYPTHRG